jgi:L-iditol 2-dehydrogenase
MNAATMLAAVLYGREDVRTERVRVPPVGRGEVRVRIGAALTCGTDLKVYRRGYHARMIVPPSVFGHEFAGVVHEVGEGAAGWQAGERVVAANSAPCDRCFLCERGRPELCEDLLFLNGAYAEYVTVPERIVTRNLLRVPDALSFEEAALVEPLACAVHAVEETGIRAGETVAILGAGPLGLMLVRLSALRGAQVICVGRRPERLAVATELGAAAVLEAGDGTDVQSWVRERLPAGRGADRVIEAVGQPATWELAVRLARPGGVVNLFGGCPSGSRLAVDTSRLHYEALTLMGTFHHTPATIRQALDLIATGAVPARPFLQGRASLAELPAVLARLAKGGGPLKVVVTPGER